MQKVRGANNHLRGANTRNARKTPGWLGTKTERTGLIYCMQFRGTDTVFEPPDLSRFFETHPVLETERLILRPRRMDDKDAIFEYASDSIATEYMIWPTAQSIQDTMVFLQMSAQDFVEQKSIGFAMELKNNGGLIGGCDFHHIEPNHHRTEIGYMLNRNFWGKGYMTEAVREMIRFAFEEMGMHRVAATCDFENERSARVMERCGMTLEGIFRDYELRRGRFVTVKMYAIVNGNQSG